MWLRYIYTAVLLLSLLSSTRTAAAQTTANPAAQPQSASSLQWSPSAISAAKTVTFLEGLVPLVTWVTLAVVVITFFVILRYVNAQKNPRLRATAAPNATEDLDRIYQKLLEDLKDGINTSIKATREEGERIRLILNDLGETPQIDEELRRFHADLLETIRGGNEAASNLLKEELRNFSIAPNSSLSEEEILQILERMDERVQQRLREHFEKLDTNLEECILSFEHGLRQGLAKPSA